MLAYQTEKQLKELGDKIPADKKKQVEDAINAVREAIERNDTDAMKRTYDDLQNKFQEISAELYKQASAAQGAQAGPQPGPETQSRGGAEEGAGARRQRRRRRCGVRSRRRRQEEITNLPATARELLELLPATTLINKGEEKQLMASVKVKPLGDRVLVQPIEETGSKEGRHHHP